MAQLLEIHSFQLRVTDKTQHYAALADLDKVEHGKTPIYFRENAGLVAMCPTYYNSQKEVKKAVNEAGFKVKKAEVTG